MARPRKNAAAALAAADTKETVKAVEVKAADKVEDAVEKVDKVKKGAAKAVKKTAVKEELFLQFSGSEISQTEIIKRVKENWTKVQKKKIKDIKKISVYLVPEQGCAYYVINGEGTDDYRIEL